MTHRLLLRGPVGVAVAALIAAPACVAAAGRPSTSAPTSATGATGTRAVGVRAANPTVAPGHVRVRLVHVAAGLGGAVGVVSPRDGSGRLMVVERGGRVRVVASGRVVSRVYLDVSSEVATGNDEQGLLSIAFHPNFARHPYVYVAYTRANDGSLQVSRFTARSAAATHVEPGSERRIILVPHTRAPNHNGGQLVFGRDGDLYIGTGDGGSEGDPFHYGEDLSSLSAKLLRIDVDRSCGSKHYCIPSGNPFAASGTKRREIFDWGLRNPWRFSVDRADGSLWIGDVGQDRYEEIDHVGERGGKDFGWSCREGDATYDSANCTIGGKPRTLTRPVHVYSHGSNDSTGCAVIGGFAYHGPKYRFAHGLYVYGDYCTGSLWALGRDRSGGYPNARVGSLGVADSLSGFGEAQRGELYAVDLAGDLYHLRFTRA